MFSSEVLNPTRFCSAQFSAISSARCLKLEISDELFQPLAFRPGISVAEGPWPAYHAQTQNTRACTRMRAHTNTRAHTYMHARTKSRTHAHLHTLARHARHAHACACACACARARTHTHCGAASAKPPWPNGWFPRPVKAQFSSSPPGPQAGPVHHARPGRASYQRFYS